MKAILLTLAAVLAPAAIATTASADISLVVVDSYARSNAFGLAYDGANIWWSDSGGSVHEMTTSGVDTGKSALGPYWSALAYNSANQKLVTMQGDSITQFDRPTAGGQSYGDLNATVTQIAGGYGGLIDGLDVEGGTLWWSPDVDRVYNSPVAGGGSATLFLGGAGGYSGVEYLSVGSNNYVFVVNDAFVPRKLCYHNLSGAELGCAQLPNSRYEDLAFDGRYLWAADYYGHRIDKIDVVGAGGGSVFDPPGGIPEPATWALMILGFGSVGTVLRRRKPAAELA
jgi:hypothetical protein